MTNAPIIPYARIARAPVNRRRVLLYGLMSCLAGLLANLIPVHFMTSMLKIPPGTAIRPMAEAASIFLGALVGLAVALPLAMMCLVSGRRWWFAWPLGMLGCALACSPWFVGNALYDWVVAKQGFIMKP